MKALRVLVVEDDAVIAMLLADMFAAMGHDVCAIEATEAGAVAAADRCRPDLMIVDARLGDGNGFSAVEKILQTGFVPHVFISGDISTVRARKPGAVAIQKPFDESALVGAIQRALGAMAASRRVKPETRHRSAIILPQMKSCAAGPKSRSTAKADFTRRGSE